jgi:dipeptidyl aminopeptidase/acylaminoacyl peptidase
MRNTLLLFLCACGGSSSMSGPVLPPPAPDQAAPPVVAAPPASPKEEPARADEPEGEAATEVAALAARAEKLVDAFANQGARVTPDGKKVVFRSNRDGNWQLYVADANNAKSAATKITTGPERGDSYTLLPDGQGAVYLTDRGADEKWTHVLVGLDGKNPTPLGSEEELERGAPIFPIGSKGDLYYYSARTMEDPATRIYAQEPKGGVAPKLLMTIPTSGGLTDVSADGKSGLVLKLISPTVISLLIADLGAASTRQLYPEEGKEVRVDNAKFSADGKVVFVSTDGGGEDAFVLALDPATGKELYRYQETDPKTAYLDDIQVSPRGDVVGVHVDAGNHDRVRILSAKTLKPTKRVTVPLGTVELTGFASDGRLLGNLSSPEKPGEIFAVSAAGKIAYLRDEPRPGMKDLAPLQVSTRTVKSFDGTEVPVNLFLPAKAAGAPVMVVVHGGPAASSKIRWTPITRFFTGLGYAVVEPNVRGSTGFGRAYEAADNGPKRLDALKDLEAVARWIGEQPWADKNRLVVTGGSYGGYMVLMAVTRQTDLWAAGIDMVGPANWLTFMKTTTGVIRDVLGKEFGDVEKDADFLVSISPIGDVDKIRVPLFVYQGKNDPRVPKAESDQIVSALRKRGVTVEYMVAENEGHSLDRRETKLAFISRVARFLDKNLPKR